MTHLSGNRLVPKNHPRIFLRGKMDSLNALIVLTQSEIASKAGNDKLVKDLDDIFAHVCMLMRCEVMDENVPEYKLLGLNDSEIRDRSHHPAKYYGVKQMTLPNKSHDIAYLRLNVIRTAVREAELAAAAAFALNATFNCSDGCGSSIIQSLNRLSSCIHIMMCMFLCGMYQ
jgi:ethanolamine utilization cobalamin adenosyltransferase